MGAGSYLVTGVNSGAYAKHEFQRVQLASKVLRKYRRLIRAKFPGLKVEMTVIKGNEVGEEVLNYTEKINCKALVVGIRNLSAMKRLSMLTLEFWLARLVTIVQSMPIAQS
jgi:nucleotide-binding universal stress UspA family protein